jgi:DNA-binding PadR family transcriptional regulator
MRTHTHHRHGAPGFGAGFGAAFGPGYGPPPWVAQMFGPEFGPGGRGRGRGRGRGPRARRGDVRVAILDVLASTEEELNGYQVIQQITDRSQGAWRPSPGSVYPTIAQLEDEGLVETVREGGRKFLRLTEEGRAYVAERADELAAVWEPFAEPEDDGDHANLRPVIGQTIAAVWQVATTGTPDQQRRAAEILADTRRQLYGLLADGPEE